MTDSHKISYQHLNKVPLTNLGLKENIFLIMVLGWSAWGLVLPNSLALTKGKSVSSILIPFCLFTLGMCIAYMDNSSNPLFIKFIFLLSSILLLVTIDCHQNKFAENAVIHLSNSAYLGIAFYFLVMTAYPEAFPNGFNFWQSLLPSAPKAFDMLLLCFLFQNIGSYILWDWITPLKQATVKWSISAKNYVNLSFIQTPQHQLTLFLTLSSFGLISRLWGLSLGNIYYTEGSGVPFYISSFLAQFDRLYVIAWLYGYSLSFHPLFKKNRVVPLSLFLISIEFIYQLFSGSKGRFFAFIILPLASTFILIKQKVSWRSVLLLGTVGISSWLILYPTLVVYRNLLSASGLSGSIDPINLFGRAFQELSTYDSEKYFSTILTPFNASGIAEQVTAMTSIIHHQVSQDGNLLWQRIFLFWVPRFLWSSKPSTLSGNFIGRLSHRVADHDTTTSVLTTGAGELYLYYGLLGSTLMILVGLLFRWMNEAISPFKYPTPFRTAVLVAFLPLMQGILSGNFEGGFTGIILQLGVLYAILAFSKSLVSLSR